MLLCVIALIAVIVHNGWSFSSSMLVEAFSANYICQPCSQIVDFTANSDQSCRRTFFFFFIYVGTWVSGGVAHFMNEHSRLKNH